MLTELEIRAIAAKVVALSKATANVDTGFLKRSIYFIYVRGVVNFKQAYYGVYDNSDLEKNARKMMPSEVPYIITLVNDDGSVFMEKKKTKGGRTIKRQAIAASNRQNSKNILALIKKIQNGKKNEREVKK